MRYCGEVMARQFMQIAKRPWTILAQLKVQPNIAYILNKTAERVLESRPDHICRRLDQEDFQKSTQQTELAPKAALNLEPPPYSHEPKQHLINVVMPNISYEKEKESNFLDDPTPVQPYLQPRDQRPWLSICQTDMTRMSKFGLLADNPHGYTSPPSRILPPSAVSCMAEEPARSWQREDRVMVSLPDKTTRTQKVNDTT
jgi:hypothetical protein